MAHPRLLLFGSPGAGKSSLLGALAQAAAIETPALKGALVDKSEALENLQKSTYQGKAVPTTQLEAYDIRLDGAAAAGATLLDCSGKDAGTLLKAEQPFATDHPMRRPILDADAVLLIVDASQPSKQLNDEFQQFGAWLNQLHETRGKRVDVGALPVYLVLTKVDHLAKKDDTFSMWMQRIEEGKRKIDTRFRGYLKDQGTGFGSLDVRLWATSIKRPQLADRPAKAQEPFGVAELFRESFDAAADFQHRRQTSQRRLQNVTVGLVGMLAMLFFAVAFLFEYQPDKSGASLDEKVQRVMPKSDVPAQRVGGTLKKLDEKRQTLAEIMKDPAFSRLSKESQTAVTTYHKEIGDYLDLTEQLKTRVKFPYIAKTEEDFAALEKSVLEFTYPKEWNETQVGKHVGQARKEYERAREELKKEEAWLRQQKESGDKLLKEAYIILNKSDRKSLEEWDLKYKALVLARRVARTDNMPGVSGVTYEFLDRFQSIKAARKAWDSEKTKLDRVSKNIQEELAASPP